MGRGVVGIGTIFDHVQYTLRIAGWMLVAFLAADAGTAVALAAIKIGSRLYNWEQGLVLLLVICTKAFEVMLFDAVRKMVIMDFDLGHQHGVVVPLEYPRNIGFWLHVLGGMPINGDLDYIREHEEMLASFPTAAEAIMNINAWFRVTQLSIAGVYTGLILLNLPPDGNPPPYIYSILYGTFSFVSCLMAGILLVVVFRNVHSPVWERHRLKTL
jgi:hypothetical protein